MHSPVPLRPAIGERFLMSYFPRPPGGGQAMRGVRGASRLKASP